MPHDKIKAAARERMARTGEPYAAARREDIREYQASAGQARLPGTGTLVWINGPEGVGKTATAFELNRRLPGSTVCDPNHVGSAMKRMLPASLWPGSWQNIPAWRHSMLELLRLTLTQHDGPVIAPSMLLSPDHYQEIIGGLRDDGFEVHHFALLAEPATVIRRLHARSLGLEPRTRPWAAEHLDEWLERLGQPEFAEHVYTDRKSVAQVADIIAGSAGLPITPSADGPVRAWMHRYATTVRERTPW
jgi:predicted kinase